MYMVKKKKKIIQILNLNGDIIKEFRGDVICCVQILDPELEHYRCHVAMAKSLSDVAIIAAFFDGYVAA